LALHAGTVMSKQAATHVIDKQQFEHGELLT
jgi:hypothetical protein